VEHPGRELIRWLVTGSGKQYLVWASVSSRFLRANDLKWLCEVRGRECLPWLAFLKGDAVQMAQSVSAAMGKPGTEDLLLATEADTEGWYGKLKNAHEFDRAGDGFSPAQRRQRDGRSDLLSHCKYLVYESHLSSIFCAERIVSY